MGWLDFLMGGGTPLERNQRKLTNRDKQPEDRESAARWLSENGSSQALMSLLSRFDVSLEHQLKDAGEKEFVYSLLAGHGPKAVEPVKEWLRQCRQFALPLRLLAELSGKDTAIGMAFEILDIERKKDDFKADKKKGLLVWLAEIRDPKVIEVVTPFLADFDEGVRYAAAEAIVAQGGDAGREALLGVFKNPREESNRLKVRVAEVFNQRGWRIEDPEIAERLPSGFAVKDGRVARASA